MLKTIEHESVLELCLDRPPVNALNPGLVVELADAVRAGGEDYQALVLSGAPGMFSAGLDVPELIRLDRSGLADFLQGFFGMLEALARSAVPVAAAITGHAPAGGAVMCLFCDYRVMSRGEFVVGLNETRVGLLVPGVIRHALVRLVGNHRAERSIVSGILYNPDQALDTGLVDALAESPEDAVGKAVAWCNEQLALPSHAMLGNRKLMRGDLKISFDSLRESDMDLFAEGWFEEQTQAALRAMLEKLGKKA